MPDTKVTTHPAMTHEEWLAEAKRRFGEHPRAWRFKCPICGNVASCGDFEKAGAEDPARAASECIGRLRPRREVRAAFGDDNGVTSPCDYAAFGLFQIGVKVKTKNGITTAFPFADDPVATDEPAKKS